MKPCAASPWMVFSLGTPPIPGVTFSCNSSCWFYEISPEFYRDSLWNHFKVSCKIYSDSFEIHSSFTIIVFRFVEKTSLVRQSDPAAPVPRWPRTSPFCWDIFWELSSVMVWWHGWGSLTYLCRWCPSQKSVFFFFCEKARKQWEAIHFLEGRGATGLANC